MEKGSNGWDAQLYNERHAFVYEFGEELIGMLNPLSHERILDLGCGTGQLTTRIGELARHVIGMDTSPDMIAEARRKYPQIHFQIGDAAAFQFEREFDSIFSNATLHWVRNYRNVITSMFNNLRPGGKVVLEFGGKGNVENIIDELRLSLRRRNYLEQSDRQPWYFPSIGEYTTALETHGFRVAYASHFDRPTELADEKSGIVDWLSMFAGDFFHGIPSTDVKTMKEEIQRNLRSKCLINGKWYADYKRIRVLAYKPKPETHS